ncbi:MAG: DUF3800 domain-containing protein [Candidatus Hydrogenedentes bacterium]|nr:DUF3800 domain-containing protein [Candidatus Hydrogenedentota bacterium]
MPEEHTHVFYVDDSGTKEYAYSPRAYSTKGGITPYFVFGGILVTPAQAGVLHHGLRRLKRDCFGRGDVEIKANWLRHAKEREARYLERFSISEDQLRRFAESVYELIVGTDCTLLACVVKKEEVQQLYAERAHYAPAIAYDILLQRVQLEMARRRGYAHIVVDDMSGATPRGNQYKDNLKKQHQRLKTAGSQLRKGFVFDRIGNLRFSDSNADERLQLADLVAYGVYRQFVEYGDAWDGDAESLPVYEYLQKLGPRFAASPSGTISGYGIVKFPRTKGRKWGLKTKNP